MSSLAELRLKYLPKLSKELTDLAVQWKEGEAPPIQPQIKELFPLTGGQPLLIGESGKAEKRERLTVGVLFSGGQAAGGHNVIWGLFEALKRTAKTVKLIGFLDGPKGLMNGSATEITEEMLAPFRNMGGFDLLGSGRDKIETPEQFHAAAEVTKKWSLDGLVIIGGDDSNTNAAFLAEFFSVNGIGCCVVGVPKTIDGDLKNLYIRESFGFDTASKTFSETIGNIAKDALSQKKYHFFIKLMGRSASHLTLECALRTHPNLALIGEEIAEKKISLDQIVDQIASLVMERAERGKFYSVILIPEGIVEFIPNFKEQLPKNLQLDPHGNLPVSQIESERLLIELVTKRLKERGYTKSFSAQPLFLGYEGRSAFPTNFDADYCFALGVVSLLLIRDKKSGYMAGVAPLNQEALFWQPIAVPITSLMQMEVRKGEEKAVVAKALVDLKGSAFVHFAKRRENWRLEDDYRTPGPIQFFGERELTDSRPISLQSDLKSCE